MRKSHVVFAVLVAGLILAQVFVPSVSSVEGTTTSGSSSNAVSYTSLGFIKLWEGKDWYHPSFMAGFLDGGKYGEYVVVFANARGDVSKYYFSVIQVASIYQSVYIYRISDGSLVYNFTGNGTYFITYSYSGLSIYKVWNRYGLFDPSGRWMVEDPEYYGTDARVINTSDPYKMVYTPQDVIYTIDWGFNDTQQGNFSYAMLTDDGRFLVVGYPAGGYVLVFKRDDSQRKYVLFQQIISAMFNQPMPSIKFGSQFYVTPDGRYLIIGYPYYPEIEIWYRASEDYWFSNVGVFALPNTTSGVGETSYMASIGGIIAIDPENLVIDGGGGTTAYWGGVHIMLITEDGWGIVCKYSGGYSGTFSVLYSEKLLDRVDGVSPVISRSLVGNTGNILAMVAEDYFNTMAKVFVYDTVGNKTYTFTYSTYLVPTIAVAVDPSSEYIFASGALWKIVRRTELVGVPRVRLEGHMWFNYTDFYIKEDSAYSPPAPSNVNWTASIMSGDVVITRARIVPDPIVIITDEDILRARFADMLSRGLVRAFPLMSVAGTVDSYAIVPREVEDSIATRYNVDPSKVVTTSATFSINALYGWNGHGFGGSTVSYATVIGLPFEEPINAGLFDNITISSDFVVATVSPVFDWKNELLGVFGIELKTSAASAVSSAAMGIAKTTMTDYLLAEFGASPAALSAIKQASFALPKALGRVLGIVGIALLVDAGIGVWYHEQVYSSVQSLVMIMPIVEAPDGKRYGVVVMVLPQDEIDNYGDEYISHAEAVGQHLGLDGVEVVFEPFGANWDEYRALLEDGHLPDINLKDAVGTLGVEYGYDVNKLKITGVKIVVETLAHGKVNFWEWVTGGLKFVVATTVCGIAVNVVGVPKEKVYTDPSDIRTLIENVTVRFGEDAQTIPLLVSDEGLKATFVAPVGVSVDKFSVVFNRKTLFHIAVDLSMRMDIYIEQPMTEVGGYMYKSYFVFLWGGTDELTPQLHLDAVGFIDMPYPLLKAVRVAIYTYGTHKDTFTQYLDLTDVVQDSSSPTGYRYTYMTTRNTLFLDPRNGGLLQAGETFIFKYFYAEPPDVSVEVLFNGTSVTSTLARHAMVGIHGYRISQNVQVKVLLEVYRKEDSTVTLISSRSDQRTIYVQADRTEWITYDIADLVDLAITTMRNENKATFVQVTAEITGYQEDEDPTNNMKIAVYYPPSNLPYGISETHTVTVFAYDARTGDGVSGVTVTLSTPDGGYWSGTTNSTGYATITVPYVRFYNVTVTSTTYNAPPMHVYVYKDGTVLVPLVPASIPTNPPANGSYSPISIGGNDYYWLSIFVSYSDGFPLDNAHVVIYDLDLSVTSFDLTTGLSGYVHVLIPKNKNIKYTIDATNPQNTSQTYHFERTLAMTQHYMFGHSVGWSSSYYTPEVYLASAHFGISRGQGYYDAPVKHLILLSIWTNYPQTVEIKLDVYNVDDPNNPVYVSSEYENITLVNGFNTIYAWVDISAPNGGNFKVKATIVDYEADTDTTNNYAWTNTQYLKPEVDYIVGITYKVVQRKVDWAVLPEDKIIVSVVIKSMNRNVTLPLDLTFTVKGREWGGVIKTFQEHKETVNAYGDVVYRNFTVTVPWTDELYINVSALHPWDDKPWNNIAGVEIQVFPDAKVSIEAQPVITEGQELKVKVRIISNVMELGHTMGLAVRDNSTNQQLGFIEVELRPEVTVELNYTIPNNPEMFAGIRYPVLTRKIVASITGDLYEGNNWAEVNITVFSSQFMKVIIAFMIIFALLIFVKVLTDTVEELRTRRYVRRKVNRFVGSIEGQTGRFVRRKET